MDVLSGITFNGNIDLIASTIHNYDLRYETYGKKGETFAVSGFLKNLYNPIEIVSYTADEDNIQPINSGNAQLMGVEVEGRKKLRQCSRWIVSQRQRIIHYIGSKNCGR